MSVKKPATKDTASDLAGDWKVRQIGALQGLDWWERGGLLKRRFFVKLTKYCEKTSVCQNLLFNCKGKNENRKKLDATFDSYCNSRLRNPSA